MATEHTEPSLPRNSRKARRTGLRLVVALAAFGLTLSACGGQDAQKEKDKAKGGAASAAANTNANLVQTAVVQTVNIALNVSGTGTISAWQEAPVGAEVGGLTAVGLYADEGQTVKQGQPLVKMDDVLLKAQYQQAKANADKTQKAYERSKELFDKGYLSKAALEASEAEAAVDAAALATAGTNLSRAVVRAPVSGIVTSRKVVLGQIIQPGAELFRIVRDGRIELNMEVIETDLSRLKAGQSATVYAEGGRQASGTIRLVTPMVDPTTRLGYARIAVPWDSGLRPGMFARAEVTLGTEDVLVIPQKAVIYSENKPGVFVVGDGSRAKFVPIELGPVSNGNVVVRSGLSAGQNVVTTGAGFISEGDPIRAGQPVPNTAPAAAKGH